MPKIVSCATIKETKKKWWWGSMSNRWISTNIHLDHSSPLGINGLHCVEFLHEMGKLLLNFVPGELLALVQELANFDKSIPLDLLLVSILDMCVCDPINYGMFHVVWV